MASGIVRAAVIGSGAMGSGIAALLANAGLNVVLLDMVPRELTAQEAARGLSLTSPEVRNRLATASLAMLAKAQPPVLFLPHFVDRITPGNLEDHLGWLGDADWVIEVVVEDLTVKRDVMARIDSVRRPDAVVSTNTSGIPIGQIAEGRSAAFRAHFLGTHFFNPPRQMRLLEIIPTADTSPEVLSRMVDVGERLLGKGVVVCKDTPNFIANRLAAIPAWHDLEYALSNGYTVEEVDAMTGSAVGRPGTATFRLRDLVGLDVSSRVAANLHSAIPHDPFRDALTAPGVQKLRETMLSRGWLGRKAGIGFYKRIDTPKGPEFWGLDLQTMEHRPPAPVSLPTLDEALRIRDLGERLRFLVRATDRVGAYLWSCLSFLLAYSASCIPEIAADVRPIDNAMKWGYGHEMGPFEIWDALGVRDAAARMEADGLAVAPWVRAMLASGREAFYEGSAQERTVYSASTGSARKAETGERRVRLSDLKAQGKVVAENADASLVDLGDGIACLEYHTKANAMTAGVSEMIDQSLSIVDAHFDGLVVGNEGQHYCAGANLNDFVALFGPAQESGDYSAVERRIASGQRRRQAFRYYRKPIVAAPFGMTLGGGAEQTMHASAICAAAELNMGLVETGVGILPGACGCKELLRRVVSPPMRTPGVDPMPFLTKVFDAIAWARISNSAEEARLMGFLGPCDRVIMSRDALLSEAKAMVQEMVRAGYHPPAREKCVYAVGQRGLASLRVAIYQKREEGSATEFDCKIAERVAVVLCGGELTSPQWVDEDYILALEREGFVSLSGEPKALERIKHMLSTGKRLRN
jgi:3-hydroxyacyl-CoA dehydrogenase